MAFTTPPVFVRPQGNPGSMREIAGLLMTLADLFDVAVRPADKLQGHGSNLYWEGNPGDVFWGGVAQENYVDSALKRMRLMEFASTTFRSAGNVLSATAEHLATAQSGVDQAQQVASQRASVDAVSLSPVPVSFEQEQQVVTTSTALAAASASEAAAKLRALASTTPGYVPPARTTAGVIPSLGGTQSVAAGADTGTGSTGSAGSSTAGGAAVSGSSSTGDRAGTPSHRDGSDAGVEPVHGSGSTAGGSGGVGGGSSAAGGGRGSDDDEPARVVEES